MSDLKKNRKSRIQPTEKGKMNWQLLEKILKNYYEFKELYENHGIEEVTVNGMTVHFLDLLRGLEDLPEKQKTAIKLMVLEGYKETETAVLMGMEAASSSQVGLWKRRGLDSLTRKYWNTSGERSMTKDAVDQMRKAKSNPEVEQ